MKTGKERLTFPNSLIILPWGFAASEDDSELTVKKGISLSCRDKGSSRRFGHFTACWKMAHSFDKIGITIATPSDSLRSRNEKHRLESGRDQMSRKGRKTPLGSCREEKAASPAADARRLPEKALGSIPRADAPTTRSIGPSDWLFAAALAVAVFLVYQPAWRPASSGMTKTT